MFRGFTHSRTAQLMLKRAQKMSSKNLPHKEGVFIRCVPILLMHRWERWNPKADVNRVRSLPNNSKTQKPFFQRENIPTNFSLFFFFFSLHSRLCSLACASAAANLSTSCKLMGHNSRQEPAPVASDRAVPSACRGNHVCQEASRHAAPRPRALAPVVAVSQGRGERRSHLRRAPRNAAPVMFMVPRPCSGSLPFDHA